MASGLALGSMFFGGALDSYVLGAVARRVGLAPALQWLALLMLAAAVAALLLPGRRATAALAATDQRLRRPANRTLMQTPYNKYHNIV